MSNDQRGEMYSLWNAGDKFLSPPRQNSNVGCWSTAGVRIQENGCTPSMHPPRLFIQLPVRELRSSIAFVEPQLSPHLLCVPFVVSIVHVIANQRSDVVRQVVVVIHVILEHWHVNT